MWVVLGAEGENGQLGTPPEVGAVDAVLNLSKDKWLKPSPAYAKVRLASAAPNLATPRTCEDALGHALP